MNPAESDFDFLEQLSPRYITVQKNSETGRNEGWKYKEGEFDSTLTIEQTLHIPMNRLAGSTWGTSPLQPLTRILDLKGNIEVTSIISSPAISSPDMSTCSAGRERVCHRK